jgi:MFS family permease
MSKRRPKAGRHTRLMATTSTRRGLGAPFRLLFLASTGSNLGDGVLLAAIPLLARRLSDDALAVSSVTVAATLPWLLFGLAAGAIVDRVDRSRLMVQADALRTVGLALLALFIATSGATLPLIIAMVFVLGAAEALCDTAAQAVLPALVDTDQLERANGRLFGAQIATNGFIGPPLGATLFAAGTVLPFGFDAATFALSAILLARLPSRRHGVPPAARETTLLKEVVEGLAWLWHHRGIRAFAVGAAVVNLAHMGAMAVIVLLVRDELGADELAFGLVLAGAAAGSIIGSQLASNAVHRLGRQNAVLASIATFSLALLSVGLAPDTIAAALGLAAFGLAGEVWNVVAVSYRQAIIPDVLLGRVMATYRVIAYGAMPIGAAVGGLTAKVLGVRATFVVGAVAVAALFITFVAHPPAESS